MSPRGEVVDHHTWVMDLEKANRNPIAEPPWYLLYSAKSAYKMSSLSPISWQKVVNKLQTNSFIFKKFYKYYHSGIRDRPPCDPACRHRLICKLVSGKSQDRQQTCKGVNVEGDSSVGFFSNWLG